MRLFLARTDAPEVMMEKFRKDPLDFLYHQEDRTDYRIKTISYLIPKHAGEKRIISESVKSREKKIYYHFASTTIYGRR